MKQATTLFLSYDGLTDDLGQSQIIPYLAGLSAEGYIIHVLSFEKTSKYLAQRKNIENILAKDNIIWHPAFFSSKLKFLSKVWDLMVFKKKALQLAKQYQINLIHARSYVSGAVALNMKEKLGIPFIFDIRGFWIDERVDNGQWNPNKKLDQFKINYYRKIEQKLFAAARKIVTLTHKSKDIIIEKFGVSESSIEVIPCCVDLNHFKINAPFDRQQLLASLSFTEDDKVLVYVGSIFGWYLTDEIFEFFSLFTSRSPKHKILLLTGDSHFMLQQFMDDYDINKNQIVIKHATRAEVPQLIRLASFSVFFIKGSFSKQASSPTKMAEFFALGVPVIVNGNVGDNAYIINKYHSGICLDELDAENYKQAISDILTWSTPEPKCIAAANDFFSLEKGVEHYKKIYQEIVND